MIPEIVFFTLMGCGIGIFTGCVPGIHVNSAVALLLPLLTVNPYFTASMIVAMAISHTIFDFVPSIMLGMPEDDTSLSVLPGHRMLMEGRGLEAIYLTVIGGVGVIALAVLALPLLLLIIPFFYHNISSYIHWVLAAMALFMILSEKGKGRIWAFACFALSGVLGILVLNSFVMPSNLLFFPLFAGLFGMSTLVISIKSRARIPPQNLVCPRIENRLALSGSVKALFSGMIVGILPGLGASQATVLTQQITRKKDDREFLVSMGGINTAMALFSLIALYTIAKPRSGAAVAVQSVLAGFGSNELILLVAATLLSTGVSSLLLIKSVKGMVSIMQRISYPKITAGVIVFILSATFFLTGPFGLLVLFTSTAIGLLPPLLNVKRSTLMGVLMLNLIIFYAGI